MVLTVPDMETSNAALPTGCIPMIDTSLFSWSCLSPPDGEILLVAASLVLLG